MPNKTLTKYGTISGGLCEQWHRERRKRERGAEWLLGHMKATGCLVANNGWWRVVRLPKLGWRDIAKVFPKDGDGQIGIFRLRDEVMDQLYRDKRAFRWSWMLRWLDGICALEFDMTSPRGKLLPIRGFYTPAHEPAIYEAKRRNGELG